VLVTLGDLVEDVVVDLDGPVNVASDTAARIFRRRGGSAANVAATAAALGARSRFIGQVGDDAIGSALIAELAAAGVDTTHVRRSGHTATIVVLVDALGERTMLVDQGSARQLDGVDPTWLDAADALHLTLYSLLDEPIATTSRALARLARERGVAVSVDVSSVALIEAAGPTEVLTLVGDLDPAIVFANADEADVLGLPGPVGNAAVVVKRGPDPCVVRTVAGTLVEVPAIPLSHATDTTGAGDAFAAGVLTRPGWRDDLAAACRAGHDAAHALLRNR
jgi:sugar/nucleoside kinase (ribokinase family)